MSARRKGRTLPRPESAAKRVLALHRQFADDCVDNIHRFTPDEPAETIADLPAGLLVPVSGGPLPVHLVSLPELAACHPADEPPPSYAEEFARALVEALRETLRAVGRSGVNRVAIVHPSQVTDHIFTLREGPRAGQTTPGTSSHIMLSIITPAAHESWLATTIWMPEIRHAHTHLTPTPDDYAFDGDTLTSFAAILSQS